MSDTNPAGMSRRQLLEIAGTAAAAAAVAGLAPPARAAQGPVALNATVSGSLPPRFVIPLVPPIKLGNYTADGTSDLLGTVQYTEANTLHVGVDGKALSVTDGIGVLSAGNGDALFVSYSGLITNDQGTAADLRFTVSGGTGRFLGASGSGSIQCLIAADGKTFSRTFQGMIAVPASA